MHLRAMLFLFFVATASASAGEALLWKVDQAHSRVQFSVSHMVIAEVTGRFKDFDATLTEPASDLTHAAIEAHIKTASIDTDNQTRDGHLRSDDFLNAEKYPEIVFKSTAIEKTGENAYNINGLLTIRDITKPVVLDAQINGTVKDPMGNMRSGFKATTTINRFEFGTRWNKMIDSGGLIAGENVSITLLMEFTQEKQ